MLAAEALRCLINAILVVPGERRGKMSLSLRGDLAAFLRMAEEEQGSARQVAQNGKAPVIAWDNRGLREVMGSLDAGTRIGVCRTELGSREAQSSPSRR